ncbi:MAG: hypothetical protein GXP29_01180 [Planctomycetes bacterium]|nr:hypothetical protein [Planctomycetota bacterium]
MPSGSQSQAGGTVNSTAACDGSGSVDGSDKAVALPSNIEPAEVER